MSPSSSDLLGFRHATCQHHGGAPAFQLLPGVRPSPVCLARQSSRRVRCPTSVFPRLGSILVAVPSPQGPIEPSARMADTRNSIRDIGGGSSARHKLCSPGYGCGLWGFRDAIVAYVAPFTRAPGEQSRLEGCTTWDVQGSAATVPWILASYDAVSCMGIAVHSSLLHDSMDRPNSMETRLSGMRSTAPQNNRIRTRVIATAL
ncbi:hypothetical protein PLICRDRAFT_44196 [Plicaturopsis crispa FD-325 SS-3]|nr:hypothetical protein PLICRDRAFT_44196 [Plicaturopsis crispa FD-325 SS-3]